MNAPQYVCAGCREPTRVDKPVCDQCAAISVGTNNVCPLCNSALYAGANIQSADRFGIHYTVAGGYAGKCLEIYGVESE